MACDAIPFGDASMPLTAFLGALVVGCALHYRKIVKNEWFGYPDEWFPSVSATIGDRYPERALFQLFIALSTGPRTAMVGLWYLITRRPGRTLPEFVAGMGLLRTLMLAGWTFVTSTDDHDSHDVLMISYLVLTLPWTLGCIALSPPNPKAVKYRKYLAGAFFGTLVPMIYFYIQHKVHRVPGAYTTYAFFEWSLILYDVAFDTVTTIDFSTLEVAILDVRGSPNGEGFSLDHLLAPRFTWAEALDTAAEIYHGFVFWSTLTSLGVTVWYFPLWHMGISGYEALVLTTISPVLLANKTIRSLAVSNQRLLHLSSLAGLAAYFISAPTLRLFAVGFGVAMACLSWATTLYAESASDARLESKVLGWSLGLILSATVKFAWRTNNPVWPIMHADNGGWNGTGLALGVLAVLRFTNKAPLVSGQAPNPRNDASAYLTACGIAGLLFGLHSLLSDTSTMILWVWEGYPIRGPISATHGWLTAAFMTIGLLLGLQRPYLAGSWLAYALGCAGAAVLTLRHNWIGYCGALAIAAYLMALCVPIVSHAARKSPATSFGLGFLLYNVMVLFHVWVVAYAFVPGGPLVRERTDWVMLSMMLLLGCGVFDLSSTPPRPQSPNMTAPQMAPRRPSQHRRYHGAAALLVNILFALATVRRVPSNDYQPHHGEDRLITAGIWTVHFSLDNDMWSSENRMRNLIQEMELDVVGLLETDLQRIIMGNRDTTQFLAEELGMYVDYGPGPNKHTWGAALLSKFPILNSTHHLLPSPVGELAPAIHATLDVYGRLVDVFVFHSGQEEDKLDRLLQSEYMSGLMGSTDKPAVLLSYLVTKPLRGNYNRYVSDVSGMHDVDPSDDDRWCEYILYKGLKRVAYARVSRSTITDTELQVAKFVVPGSREESVALEEAGEEERDRRVDEGDVPEGWRFPALFKGEGVRGHRYHVFDEPRYYDRGVGGGQEEEEEGLNEVGVDDFTNGVVEGKGIWGIWGW
ncbi:related to CWH43 - putative sensor/transporter protein [Cephalotrichum gorgonifer]|uniref:Related to CWH43 - putative sensor/transporter protein n=1 Tax=Cephalotrichum gorgonifer TaxID=2041049 RepID=A0AAE8MSY0_9PEZI|nr:related to CWH43 - putative sensor/transporter protein [Cephalotrichum gorgonifer]